MRTKRPLIPKEKVIKVNDAKKIDFSKPYTFIYLQWWFYFLTFIPFFICAIIATIAAIYYRLQVVGKQHTKILKKQGCITISNHCHYYDTVFANWLLYPKKLHVSVVQRNFEVPYVRRILRIVRAFPIPRKQGIETITPVVGAALRKKHHVHFLPEGNLVLFSQTIYKFQRGAFYLSYIHQAPILPMVYVLQPRKRFNKALEPHHLKFTLVVGEPLLPPPLEQGDNIPWEKISNMADKAATWMEEVLAEYHKQIP